MPVSKGNLSLLQILYRIGFDEAVCTGNHGRKKKSIAGSFGSRIPNNDQIKTCA